jgi:hypothetical protein
MHHVAEAAAEEGVIPVVAVGGKTEVAARPHAVVVGAEIPASRALAEVAADGRPGAGIGPVGCQGRACQRRVGGPHLGIEEDAGQRRERPDAHAAVGEPAGPLEVIQLADVYDLRRPWTVDVERARQLSAPGGNARTSGGKVRNGLGERPGDDDGQVRGHGNQAEV